MCVFPLKLLCFLIKIFFRNDLHCQLLVAKTTFNVWADLILRHRDAVLAKIKDNISFKYFMDLCNSPLSGSSEHISKDTVEKAVVKATHVLRDEAVRKAVTQDKPTKEPQKCLQFLQSMKQAQSSKQSGYQPSRQSSGRGSSSSGSKLLLPPANARGGRSFEGSLPHHVLGRPQGCVFSDSHLSRISRYLRFAVFGKVYQFWVLCFGLSMASQVFIRVFAMVSKGDPTSSLPGLLVSCRGVGSSPPPTLEVFLSALSGPGDCH